MAQTYPHSIIRDNCIEKFGSDPWVLEECVINSLMLYYGSVKKEHLDQTNQKYVELPTLPKLREFIELV